MILLVHSCTGREWILEYWEKFFELSGWGASVKYITNDLPFSDQLMGTLAHIESEYVWHILDDYFIKTPIDWDYYWRLAQELKVDALRVQPNVSYRSLPYRFRREGDLLRQTNNSQYQISFASSIWRRKFFLDCLTPGLDPWAQENSKKINVWNHKIYFVPELSFWYVNGTVKGTLTKEGLKMVND
jgi:hypothetical protein